MSCGPPDPYRLGHDHYAHQMGKKWPEEPAPCWDDYCEDEKMAWRAGFEEYERESRKASDALAGVHPAHSPKWALGRLREWAIGGSEPNEVGEDAIEDDYRRVLRALDLPAAPSSTLIEKALAIVAVISKMSITRTPEPLYMAYRDLREALMAARQFTPNVAEKPIVKGPVQP